MKASKTVKQGIAILAILFVAYTVVVFAVPWPKNWGFWVSYLFTVLAMAAQLYVFRVSFKEGKKVRSKFYGFPIARLGVLYLIAQIVLGVVFMLLSLWVPVWVMIVVYILLAAVAAIGMIAADVIRNEIQRQDKVILSDTKVMRALQSKARMMADQCTDTDTAKALRALSETLQYSDPVSSEALAGIEADLAALVDELQAAVLDSDWDSAAKLCAKASYTLGERNRLCKLNK